MNRLDSMTRAQVIGYLIVEGCSTRSTVRMTGVAKKTMIGDPDPKHVSTSFVERQNWSLHTSIRRMTRLSNGFGRKASNHSAAIAPNYFAYNFMKIHSTLHPGNGAWRH